VGEEWSTTRTRNKGTINIIAIGIYHIIYHIKPSGQIPRKDPVVLRCSIEEISYAACVERHRARRKEPKSAIDLE
jgi:hypothetical protein